MVGILGILAAITIPNAVGFISTSRLNAANTELRNVKTAAMAFMTENQGMWPVNESVISDYISGDLTGEYDFDITSGLVIDATGWSGFFFNQESQTWQRGP